MFTTCVFDNFGRVVSSHSENYNKTILYGASAGSFKDNADVKAFGKNRIESSGAIGVTAFNFIENGGAETTTNIWDTTRESDITTSASTSYSGKKSYFYYRTPGTVAPLNGIWKSITLGAGTYTFSASIRLNGGSAPRTIRVQNDSTGEILKQAYGSNVLNREINDGWEQLSVTFTIQSTTTLNLHVGIGESTNGSCYIDNIQLGRASGSQANNYGPSEFNVLNNGSFEYNSGSTITSWTKSSNVSIASNSANISRFNNSCIKVIGSRTSDEYVKQLVYPGSADISYVFSGWAKADSLPTSDSNRNIAFELFADATYVVKKANGTNETRTKSYSFPFAWECSEWQFVSGVIALPALAEGESLVSFSSVYVGARYKNNGNIAYFDNLSLAQTTATSYKYDDNGNIVATGSNGYGTEQSTYNNSNDLTKFVNSQDKTYNYTYNSQHDVTIATSPSSIKYGITYNGRGQVTGTTISHSSTSSTLNTRVEYYGDAAGDQYNNRKIKSSGDNQGAYTNYTYNSSQRQIQVDDPNRNKTRFAYYANGLLERTYLDANESGLFDAGESNVKYNYNTKNMLSQIITNTTTYDLTYTAQLLAYQTKVGGNVLVTNEYNNDDTLLTKSTYGNGAYKSFVYDNVDNLIEKKYNGTTLFKWQYNSNGNVISHTDQANGMEHEYQYCLLYTSFIINDIICQYIV